MATKAWAEKYPNVFGGKAQFLPYNFAAAFAGDVITPLRDDQAYAMAHNGFDSAGVASVVPIFVGLNGHCTGLDFTEEEDKLILLPGRPVLLPAGITALYVKCASGTPTFQVVPAGLWFGKGY